MEPVTVRRSALKMWIVSLIGVPLIVVAVDVLFSRRLSGGLLELFYNGETLEELFEGREQVWGAVIGLVGLAMTGLGLKELLVPKPVLATTPDGLGVKVLGPARSLFVIPWNTVHDVRGVEGSDEGDKVRLLEIEVKDPAALPGNPWGARRAAPTVLQMLANDWERPPETVADEITQYVVSLTKRSPLPEPLP